MTDTASEKVAAWHLHRRLYNWVIHFADTPHGERALFLLSSALPSRVFFRSRRMCCWRR
ncbi:MAG: hypothetical protein ACYSUT_08995 [Planctomycetota bacterium]|jgi:hypothetical protein